MVKCCSLAGCLSLWWTIQTFCFLFWLQLFVAYIACGLGWYDGCKSLFLSLSARACCAAPYQLLYGSQCNKSIVVVHIHLLFQVLFWCWWFGLHLFFVCFGDISCSNLLYILSRMIFNNILLASETKATVLYFMLLHCSRSPFWGWGQKLSWSIHQARHLFPIFYTYFVQWIYCYLLPCISVLGYVIGDFLLDAFINALLIFDLSGGVHVSDIFYFKFGGVN